MAVVGAERVGQETPASGGRGAWCGGASFPPTLPSAGGWGGSGRGRQQVSEALRQRGPPKNSTAVPPWRLVRLAKAVRVLLLI